MASWMQVGAAGTWLGCQRWWFTCPWRTNRLHSALTWLVPSCMCALSACACDGGLNCAAAAAAAHLPECPDRSRFDIDACHHELGCRQRCTSEASVARAKLSGHTGCSSGGGKVGAGPAAASGREARRAPWRDHAVSEKEQGTALTRGTNLQSGRRMAQGWAPHSQCTSSTAHGWAAVLCDCTPACMARRRALR